MNHSETDKVKSSEVVEKNIRCEKCFSYTKDLICSFNKDSFSARWLAYSALEQVVLVSILAISKHFSKICLEPSR